MPVSKEVIREQLRKIGPYHKWFTAKERRALPKILDEGEVIES